MRRQCIILARVIASSCRRGLELRRLCGPGLCAASAAGSVPRRSQLQRSIQVWRPVARGGSIAAWSSHDSAQRDQAKCDACRLAFVPDGGSFYCYLRVRQRGVRSSSQARTLPCAACVRSSRPRRGSARAVRGPRLVRRRNPALAQRCQFGLDSRLIAVRACPSHLGFPALLEPLLYLTPP